MIWIHEATVVVPVGQRFPLDMLRYDCCYPASQEDVVALGRTLEGTLQRRPTEETKVRVRGHRDSKAGVFTDGRWRSFGVTLEHATARKL